MQNTFINLEQPSEYSTMLQYPYIRIQNRDFLYFLMRCYSVCLLFGISNYGIWDFYGGEEIQVESSPWRWRQQGPPKCR